MVVSRNTFLDGSVELPSPPKTGASISINAIDSDTARSPLRAPHGARHRERSAAISGGFDHPARLSEAVMNQFRPAKKRITVSVGQSVRIIRELQGLSQNQLAQRTGIPQATLSAIENDRVRLGVERAKVLAKALKCHPAVLVFPGWQDHLQTAA
jgi:ribosome-binding protein aMBF1 (putative translation factor)